MRERRTPSGIWVTLLDLTPVCEGTVDHINRARQQVEDAKPPMQRASVNYRWGVVPTERGVYALCDEGVGPSDPITTGDPLQVDVWEDCSGEGFISIFPVAQAVIQPDELLTYVTTETLPLEDFIRTFGARLDANYEQWRRLLESACVIA